MMDPRGIIRLLERNGYRAVILPFSRVKEAKAEMKGLLASGLLDKEFFGECLSSYLKAKTPKTMPRPKSVLIVSSRGLQSTVKFELDGKEYDFVVPPTYADGDITDKMIRGVLKEAQDKDKFRLVRAFPPLKLMAVRGGLAMYGRNNITFVPGYGSFQRLTGYYSDLEAHDDGWGEKKALPKCAKCRACITACPTCAISEDRFLLRAERCIAFMNERSNDHPFPSWVKPDWHNSIVGCMICQRACPYNREQMLRVEEGERFSESETKLLLSGHLSGKNTAVVRAKLKRAGLDASTFPRNLEVLLRRARAP